MMKSRAGDAVDVPQKFLELLLQQGYVDLAEQDFTHQHIEKILDLKDEPLKVIEEAITSKSILNRNKKIAEENEALRLSLSKILSHRISQDVVAHRANACLMLKTVLQDVLVCETTAKEEAEMMSRIRGKETTRMRGSADFQGTVRTLSPTGVSPSFSVNFIPKGETGEAVAGSASPTVPKAAPQSSDMNSESGSVSSKIKSEEEKEREADMDAALVTAGNPLTAPSLESDDHAKGPSSVAGIDDVVGNAISELLGSIFKGFRGDKGTEDRDEESVTEPQGEKIKISTAILDPPGSNNPPRKEYTPRDTNDNEDAIEKRNPVNWGEEIPEGDLSAFLALGPNARIRYISQKEEMGKKYIYLEGKSLATDGAPSLVIKQWIIYEEALEFLKNGFQGPRSEEENKIKIEEINIDYKNVVNEKKEEVKEEVGENNSYMRLPNKKDERAQMM